MKQHNCVSCRFRAQYLKKPSSLLGRLWKWHTSWCPGWKRYTSTLSIDEQMRLNEEMRKN